MKKKTLIFIFILFTYSLFGLDDSTMYWEKEIDLNGQLQTYYFVKTDEQLLNNLQSFISNVTGITNPYLSPNITTIKQQMVSKEYIEKNYPAIYNKYINIHSTKKENIIDLDEYKYCFTGISTTNDSGFFILIKIIEKKVYFSITGYRYSGVDWYYTNQLLDLFESYLISDYEEEE